ncbi:MAG: hypothetical protein GXX80_11785 [Thermotogaceae bacterium]|nr:hypothetical protein [Thermotogaceae bacterium]
MNDSIWEIVFRVVEGRMLAPKQVHKLWAARERIEQHTESMIFSTSSIIYLQKDRIEPNEKITKDASAVRVLEIMDQAMESLTDEDRRAWGWRYSEGMTLEEVGQMITDAPRGCRDAVTFWRMKAKRKLDHVALVLARKMWRGA